MNTYDSLMLKARRALRVLGFLYGKARVQDFAESEVIKTAGSIPAVMAFCQRINDALLPAMRGANFETIKDQVRE